MISFSFIQNRFIFLKIHNFMMNWSIFQIYILEYHSKFIRSSYVWIIKDSSRILR